MQASRESSTERSIMADTIVPCYGGPKDGAFYANNKMPVGYRVLNVRGLQIFVWNTIKVERIDFTILHKAAKVKPSTFDNIQEDE